MASKNQLTVFEEWLHTSVDALPEIGERRAELLKKLKIREIRDALLFLPRRHEDRRSYKSPEMVHSEGSDSGADSVSGSMSDSDGNQPRQMPVLTEGSPILISGKIIDSRLKRLGRYGRAKSLLEVQLEIEESHEAIIEASGNIAQLRWWNAGFLAKKFVVDTEWFVFGKINQVTPLTMDHPEMEEVGEDESENRIHLDRITPVYRLTEGVGQRWLRGWIWSLLEEYQKRSPKGANEMSSSWNLVKPPIWWSKNENKNNSSEILKGLDPFFGKALLQAHFPDAPKASEPARRRLALEEYAVFQSDMAERRRRLIKKAGRNQLVENLDLYNQFMERLPFQLTEAQNQSIDQILTSFRSGAPMRRLLQGDVGSGKTVVAAAASAWILGSGGSVAWMAPTEILAEQHYRSLSQWFDPLGIPTFFWTGSRKESSDIFNGQPRVFVGTHALAEKAFEVDNLGLAMIDEQHKFGVRQRERLLKKGVCPHLLTMTATPIPRTLGLTLYGDLDVTVMRGAPPGRGEVRTFLRPASRLPKIWAFLRERFEEGRQAYIVYPKVQEELESDSTQTAPPLKSVLGEWKKIRDLLDPYTVDILHGQMPADEKEAAVARFRKGETRALVATTVVEVGVDVPNATVMVIEGAERFGLAQLHQLRGRIGRGSEESFCILVAEPTSEEGLERLKAMTRTRDGFEIAELDFQQRGPGEFLGSRQSGAPTFKFGDLKKDLDLLTLARELVEGHPMLENF